MRGKLALGVAFVALVGAGFATYAWAASTDSQTINACVNDAGKLRLVPAVSECKKAETPLSWNTVGPAGPTGPAGAQGPAGQAAGRDLNSPAIRTPSPERSRSPGHGRARSARRRSRSRRLAEIVSPRDPASGLRPGSAAQALITKQLDKTTPLFLNALVNNENLTSVLIGLLRNGQQVATIKLTNASIADYTANGETEHWSFTYQKIEWTWLDGGITAEDDWEAPVS